MNQAVSIRQRIKATVTAANVAQDAHAPSRSIGYTGTVHTPEGDIRDVPFQRPEHEPWPPNLHVWPLKLGSLVECFREGTGVVGGWRYYFQYTEQPLFRKCDGTIVPRY